MRKAGNILVITYWPLDNALITTYTLPYIRIILRQLGPGKKVWLMTLTGEKFRKSKSHGEIVNKLKTEGIESIDFGYQNFGLGMLVKAAGMMSKLLLLCSKRNITHIHAWCTPGGAIGYLLSVLTGKPLILDSYEPHAETMVETGNWKRSSLAFRLLFSLEKKQSRKAKHIICAAPGMMDYARQAYGINRAEEYVKPACVDLSLFRPEVKMLAAPLGYVTCVYAGKFGGIYLEKETFDFFEAARTYWKEKFRVLLLTSHSEAEIKRFCEQSGFPRNLISTRFVPHEEVPKYVASADFAICPVKPIPTKRYCSPIKDGEYWACGLPVVITRDISNDSQIIHEKNAGYVLQNTSRSEYLKAAEAIDKILKDPTHKQRIRKIAEEYRNFSIAENIYRSIYA